MEAVLASAVPVFREHGYDGASIDLLKEATGLTAGSLYKAFKDKKGVFAAAFTYYVEDRQQQLAERLRGSRTGRERIAETLRFYLDSASGPEGRQGCLVLAGLIEATTLDGALHDALGKALANNRSALIAMLREGQEDGSIRSDLVVEPCADILLGLLQGLRAVGKLHDPADHDALIATALKILD
ncbi:TetR/AcrR family transcriptional regulator [Aurantimonas sp. VKM B-3413]|uniref:TetR/AcrR family transcriptional regulator n=1 Tax=Aurantimonas sp. VKM B-3413 TaxID=2779401 RepID=UPI001E4A4DD6|nr:TetR/AcrR family transcriptional regulator [Aurantimonas sp. VKM B-3413]MCB8840255.1 TetR/AcrR family transcriptional regulator [Aurantimonas sp. VKM B-3413]